MVLGPDVQKNLPNQENLLLDYVRRLETHRAGRAAVQLHLSMLRPENRRDQHLRAAATNLEPLIEDLQGQLFTLRNGDFFFVYKKEVDSQVRSEVQKIRFMFGDDPMFDVGLKADDTFSTYFDVEHEYERVLAFAQSFIEEEPKKAKKAVRGDVRSQLRARQKHGEPMTPEVLVRVEKALERADLSNMVRRQYICGLSRKLIPETVFSEMFISISDLRETLIPGINLTANRWLFQHLTESLDRRMLSMLAKSDKFTLSGDISFNANVSTLLSPEFMAFDDSITASRRGSMIIELQQLDVFADLGAYFFAREYVQERGYRILLDGMTYKTMAMIDRERLGADLVKLSWDPEMVDGGPDMHESIRDLVKRAGSAKVIMGRCDTREAIDFGRIAGISLFQGRFIESLLADDSRRQDLLKIKRRIERT